MSNTQNVDIFELTCTECGHVYRIINDDRQDSYGEYCPECGKMLPCENGVVIANTLATLVIDLDTFEVTQTFVYTKVCTTDGTSS